MGYIAWMWQIPGGKRWMWNDTNIYISVAIYCNLSTSSYCHFIHHFDSRFYFRRVWFFSPPPVVVVYRTAWNADWIEWKCNANIHFDHCTLVLCGCVNNKIAHLSRLIPMRSRLWNGIVSIWIEFFLRIYFFFRLSVFSSLSNFPGNFDAYWQNDFNRIFPI